MLKLIGIGSSIGLPQLEGKADVLITRSVTISDMARKPVESWAETFLIRCRENYLDAARGAAESRHAFASIVLSSSLVEFMAGVIIGGGNTTNRNVKAFIRKMVPEYQGIAEELYSLFRCGLVHNGQIKTGGLASFEVDESWRRIGKSVVVNPGKLVDALERCIEREEQRCQTDKLHAMNVGTVLRKMHLSDLEAYTSASR